MAIHSETRTTHTVFIDLPDDILGKIASGDEVEVVFQARDRAGGRMPKPMRLSWSWVNYLMGWSI